MDPILKGYDDKINDLKTDTKEQCPEITFNIEDIASYVQAKRNLEKWTGKTVDAKETVEIMIPKTGRDLNDIYKVFWNLFYIKRIIFYKIYILIIVCKKRFQFIKKN